MNSTASGSALERRRMSARAAASFAGFRLTSTVRAAARARITATSSPRPLLAPVTRAVFPARPGIDDVGSAIATPLPLEEAAQQRARDGDRVVDDRSQLAGQAQRVARDTELAQRGTEVEIHPLADQRVALEFKDERHTQAHRAAGGGEAAPRAGVRTGEGSLDQDNVVGGGSAVRLEVEIRERHAVLVQQPVYAVPAVVDLARWDDFVAWVPECGDAAIEVVRVLVMHVLEHDRQPALRGRLLVFCYGRSLVPTHGSPVVGTLQGGSRQSSDRQANYGCRSQVISARCRIFVWQSYAS